MHRPTRSPCAYIRTRRARALYCLQSSSLRSLDVPWTVCLQMHLSSAALISWHIFRPVQDLIFSIPLVLGLPRACTPVVPCIISFSKQSPLFLTMWPKYFNFLVLKLLNSCRSVPICSKTHSFVLLAVQETLNIVSTLSLQNHLSSFRHIS